MLYTVSQSLYYTDICKIIGISTNDIDLPLLDTVVQFPEDVNDIVDQTDVFLLDPKTPDDMVISKLVEALRNLDVSADKPFVIYRTHPKAPFDLLLVIYRQGLPPICMMINNKSETIRAIQEYKGWLNYGFF